MRRLTRARWLLRRSPWSLALLAWTTALVVQSGSFGTVDTWHRYQVTRSFWRGEPAVSRGDFPGFGIEGLGGHIQAWYGIGQSLVMLPADLLAAALTRPLHVSPALRHKLEMGIVAFATFPLIAAANALLAYQVLRRIGRFGPRAAALGVVAWLFGSSVLSYMQLHFENSLDLCLCLGAVLGTFGWAETGRRAPLAAAALAGGFDALVRLPNLVEPVLFVVFALGAARPAKPEARAAWWRSRVRDLAVVWLPVIAAALLVDRAYQLARFGWDNLTTTYIHLYGLRERARDPALPATFPFSGSFVHGLLAPLLDRNRSVWLFDPLAAVSVWLLVRSRRGGRAGSAERGTLRGRSLRYLGGAALAGFSCLLCGYARYVHWEGGVCWSDRFLLTPIQLLTLLAVPLYLRARSGLPRLARAAMPVVLSGGIGLALASILVEPNLEVLQAIHCKRALNVVPDRLANVARELLGVDRDGLSCGGAIPESYQRPELLPFGNGRDLPVSAQRPVLAAWLVLVAGFGLALANALRGVLAARSGLGAPARREIDLRLHAPPGGSV